MKKKFCLSSIVLLLMLNLVACSGDVQIEMPEVESIPEEQSTTSDVPGESEELAVDESEDTKELATLQSAFISIYEQVKPSVVSITASKALPGDEFGAPPKDDESFNFQEIANGSGFVWDNNGHIVTNNHVIASNEVIRVSFPDGRSVLAEIVGTDADSDLAVLKVDIPSNELVPITIIDSTEVEVGQIVVAIGDPFQLRSSMTTGIVSGVGRSLPIESTVESGFYYTIPDVIQTDAAINPGNSGGVLVDINGGLIGVTTAIESPVPGNTGVGYVIPSIIVQKIVPILIREGKFEQPWIGISGRNMIPEFAEVMGLDTTQKGALVVDVGTGSPAEEAGLQGSSIQTNVDGIDYRVGGDVITAADGQPIHDFEDLVAFLARYTVVDQTIALTVIRDGEELEIDLTLAARPGTEPFEEAVETEE